MTRLLAVAVLVALQAFAARGDAPVLDGRSGVRELGPYASFSIEAGRWPLWLARLYHRMGGFDPVPGKHLDPGYGTDPVWMAIPLATDAAAPVAYLFATNLPYIPALDIFVAGPDRPPQHVLHKPADIGHTDWLFDGQSVVSEQFLVRPGERAVAFVRFTPHGFGILPLSLETPVSNFERRMTEQRVSLGFYTFALTIFVVLLVLVLALRPKGGGAFLGFIASGLVLLAQLDGFWHAWLWPDAPGWNLVASFPMLLAVCATGFRASAAMLETGAPTMASRMLRGLGWISLAPLLLAPFIAIVWLTPIGLALLILAMAAQGYAVVGWTPLLPRRRILAFLAAALFLVGVALTTVHIMTGTPGLSANSLLLVKLLYALVSTPIMLAYAAHITALNRRSAEQAARALELSRNEARITAELLEAERNFAQARRVADAHQERLAAASHDLKQPIASLRMTLGRIAPRIDAAQQDVLSRALAFLEDLAEDNLAAPEAAAEAREEDSRETVEIGVLTETVVAMFGAEAAAKDLRLRHLRSCASAHIPVLPVMRILTNLLSNAVKHTEAGGVLIGPIRRGGRLGIAVTDTGPGMSETGIAQMTERYAKGTGSQGSGLGLAICTELARQHGLDFSICSVPGKGTQCRLLL